MKIVTVQLDKERHLKFCVRAFMTIEKTLGVTLDQVDFSKQESIYAMLLGGLIHEDKTLDLDKVIDIIDEVIEKRVEETGEDFMTAFANVLQELGEAVGKAMDVENKVTPNE